MQDLQKAQFGIGYYAEKYSWKIFLLREMVTIRSDCYLSTADGVQGRYSLFHGCLFAHSLRKQRIGKLGKRVRLLLFYKKKHVGENRSKMDSKTVYQYHFVINFWPRDCFHRHCYKLHFFHLLSFSPYGYLSKGKDVRNGYFDLYFYVWSVEKQKANSHEQFFQSIYLKRYYFGCDLEFLIR